MQSEFSRLRFVIWGLRKKRHSHRYIFSGFHDTLRRLGAQVHWVEDEKKNESVVTANSIVLAVGFAAQNLPSLASCKYVLHNFSDEKFFQLQNFLNLQTWTNKAVGESIDDSIALFDTKSRTLFQPWGIPESTETWLRPNTEKSKNEFWIGSVWDNNLNQGNKLTINEYKKVLKQRSIRFKRLGSTRHMMIDGIASDTAMYLVNKSAYGAAIVGEWQKASAYIPCRAFKNVASGKIPISNSDLSLIFGNVGVFDSNLNSLLDKVDNYNKSNYEEASKLSQAMIRTYTYDRGLLRILHSL